MINNTAIAILSYCILLSTLTAVEPLAGEARFNLSSLDNKCGSVSGYFALQYCDARTSFETVDSELKAITGEREYSLKDLRLLMQNRGIPSAPVECNVEGLRTAHCFIAVLRLSADDVSQPAKRHFTFGFFDEKNGIFKLVDPLIDNNVIAVNEKDLAGLYEGFALLVKWNK